MQIVKLKDVVMRVKDKIDKDSTNLEYYIGGEHIDSGELCITRKGRIEGSTIGPAFHMHFMPGDVLLMSRKKQVWLILKAFVQTLVIYAEQKMKRSFLKDICRLYFRLITFGSL